MTAGYDPAALLLAEQLAALAEMPQPEQFSEAEWLELEAREVAFACELAREQRIAGSCDRCTAHSADLVGIGTRGLCGECANDLAEVAS